MGVGREQGRHARLRNDHQRGRARGPRHGPTGRSDQSPAEHNSCGVPSQRQPDRGRWRLGLGDRRGRVGGTYRPDDRQTASDPGRRLPGLGDHLRGRCGVGARRARRTIGPARGALRLAARSTNPSPLRPDCGASERRQRSGCRGGVGVGGQPLGRAGDPYPPRCSGCHRDGRRSGSQYGSVRPARGNAVGRRSTRAHSAQDRPRHRSDRVLGRAVRITPGHGIRRRPGLRLGDQCRWRRVDGPAACCRRCPALGLPGGVG